MARWTPVPVAGGSYSDDAKPWTVQDTVNYLPVAAEREGTRSPAILRQRPGYSLFANTNGSPIRGMHDAEGLRLVVAGTSLYSIHPITGEATSLGTIPGVGRVSMAHNQITGGVEVVIATGSSAYVWNTVTAALSQVTDDGFPGAKVVDFCDGYIMFVEPFGRYWGHSDLAAATSYNTLDRSEAEAQPDRIVTGAVSHREWVVFGERSTEFYRNTGGATGTFQRINGTEAEVGAAGTHTVAKLDNTLFVVGSDGVGYRLNGYQFQRITTHAIEQAWSRCNLADAYCFTFEDHGHKVWYVSMTDGRTWGYDVATGEWHRCKSYGLDFWRMSHLIRWGGRWYGGDYTNGKVYLLDWRLNNDAGEPLERERTFAVMHDSGNRLFLDAILFEFDTGKTEDSPPLPVQVLPGIAIAGNMGDGLSGNPETGTYTSTGGQEPKTYAVTAGVFPAGLTLASDGSWSGIRTTTGAYSWEVTVTGANGNSATIADASITGIAPDTLIVPTNIHYTGNPGALTYVLNASPPLRSEAIPVCASDGLTLAGANASQVLAIYEWDMIAGSYTTATITGTAPNLGTTNAVQTVAISSDGDWVFSLDFGTPNIVVLHRTAPGEFEVVETFATAAGNTGAANGQVAIILSPDGARLATVTSEGASIVRTFEIAADGSLTPEHTSASGFSGSCFRLDWVSNYIVHEDYFPASGTMRVLDANNALAVLSTTTGAGHRLIGWNADASYLYTVDNTTPYAIKAWVWDGVNLVGSNTYTTNLAPDKGSQMAPGRGYLAHFSGDTVVYAVNNAILTLTDTLTEAASVGVWANPGRIA